MALPVRALRRAATIVLAIEAFALMTSGLVMVAFARNVAEAAGTLEQSEAFYDMATAGVVAAAILAVVLAVILERSRKRQVLPRYARVLACISACAHLLFGAIWAVSGAAVGGIILILIGALMVAVVARRDLPATLR